jgi:hypothetical protein
MSSSDHMRLAVLQQPARSSLAELEFSAYWAVIFTQLRFEVIIYDNASACP